MALKKNGTTGMHHRGEGGGALGKVATAEWKAGIIQSIVALDVYIVTGPMPERGHFF